MKKKKRILIVISIIILISLLIGIPNRLYIKQQIKFFYLDAKYAHMKNQYTTLLQRNKEDFEYVSETLQQWSDGHIFFQDEIISDNLEISNEIKNNAEFYQHLEKLHKSNKIGVIGYDVYPDRKVIVFYLRAPEEFYCQLRYKDKESFQRIQVDENWILQMSMSDTNVQKYRN